MTESATVLGKSVKGASYNVAVSAVTMVLGFVRSVLLMRYLGPDEFGYVSLALFFVVFLTHLSTFGLDSALIQRQAPRQETFSTHLTLRIFGALAVFLLALLLSPLLRLIYEQAPVVDVLLVLLLANVLAALLGTPGAVLRRELRFGVIAVLDLCSSVAMSIGAPLMAYWGAGVWSLVFERVVGYLVRWIGLWLIVRPWRPALGFDWGEAKSLMSFGRHVLLGQFLGSTLDRFDDFWAGTALGATALGYYSRAYEIARYPKRVLVTPITSVFFATYAALQDDKSQVARAFLRSSGFLVRAGFLMAVVLLVAIPEATLLLFGVTWLPIVPVFRLMAIYVVLDPLYINLSYLALGLGHPEALSQARLLQLALFLIAVPALAHLWGVQGIAVAADLMILCGVLALLRFAYRHLSLSLGEMLRWPLVALAASVAVGTGLSYGIVWEGPWLALAVKGSAVAATYVLILGVTEWQAVRAYGEWVQSAFRLRIGYTDDQGSAAGGQEL